VNHLLPFVIFLLPKLLEKMFSVPGKFVYMMRTVFDYYVLGEAVGMAVTCPVQV
jgi:hypothetical protein